MMQELATVYAAELVRRIKSRPFIIGVVIGVVGIMLLVKLPTMLDSAFSGSKSVVLIGDASLTAKAKPMLDDYKVVAMLPNQPIDEAMLKENDANAAIVLSAAADGLHVTIFAKDPGRSWKSTVESALLPLQLALTTHRSASDVAKISEVPVNVQPVASKFTSASQATSVRGVAYTLLFFLYILILVNSQLVMSSVAEEKTSRIAELLIASVNPSALLTGKILASATLGVLQLAIWVGTASFLGGGVSSTHGDSTDNIFSLANMLDIITPGVVVAFIIYFIIGFLQISTLFAGAASLINRTEDLGSITMPLVLPVVAAFFVAIASLGSPDMPLSVVCSFVPLISPFVMFARIAVSNVPLWQVAISIGINLVALYLIAVLAGRVYRVGMLLYGRAPSLKQVWSVIRSS